jgi:hypothetical protein
MSLLTDDEKEDFRSVITGAGFPEADFELNETEDPPQAGVYPISGRVSVRRKSTGVTREYAAGHMTQWLGVFDHDLRAGAFGHA